MENILNRNLLLFLQLLRKDYNEVESALNLFLEQVGKTGIVSQFLYDSFISGYKETMDEMYHGEFDIKGIKLNLDIQDTGGGYVDEFPAMLKCSLASADAVLLVYSVDDIDSFDEVSRLRDLVHLQRGEEMPLVVVGNKTDLERQIPREEAEATVLCDWENGYVECCAKDNLNVTAVFRALLVQAKFSFQSSPSVINRRQSLPQIPVFSRLQSREGSSGGLPNTSPLAKRRASMAANGRRNSCKTQ